MATEAPISKQKKTVLLIYIVACLAFAAWCAYDGYYNQDWIDEHTAVDGSAKPYLVFNRHAPPYFVGAAVLFGIYLFAIRNRKIVAGETELAISRKVKIPYDSIQKIDKTYFKPKGFFVLTYNDAGGREVNRKLSDRDYDNLQPVLDELVAKIS